MHAAFARCHAARFCPCNSHDCGLPAHIALPGSGWARGDHPAGLEEPSNYTELGAILDVFRVYENRNVRSAQKGSDGELRPAASVPSSPDRRARESTMDGGCRD